MTGGRFCGPVFIVGVPRSGTKLLRELLNRNQRIGIPSSESHFIPYMVRRFGPTPRFDDPIELRRLYEALTHTNFFRNMQEKGWVLPKDALDRSEHDSWPAVLETIFRFYAPSGRAAGFIWGDKTPSHLVHMNQLKSLFPQARFVHIIRDPRDTCLSAHTVWGKSLLRAADRWQAAIERGLAARPALGDDYIELHYEELLTRTESVLRQVCGFLDCDFTVAMLELETPSENLGATKDEASVVADNLEKYRKHLPRRKIRRIEEIVYPAARACGYEIEVASRSRPLGPLARLALTLLDGWASVRFHVRSKGLLAGLRYITRFHRQVRWHRADASLRESGES